MKKIISIAAMGLLASVSTGWAADSATLEKKVEELTRQNQMLLERVTALETMLVGRGQPTQFQGLAEKADIRQEKGSVEQRLQQIETTLEGSQQTAAADQSLLQSINDHVDLTGLVEVEAISAEDFNGDHTSDISLATVEVGLDARISDWSQAHLLLLYEEDEEDNHLIVDEGTITFGKLDVFPAYLTVGKMYLPFGSYVTNMISDTLPLELGEIRDSAVLAGFQSSGFYGSLYGFNGVLSERGENDKIDAWGASLGFAHEREGFSVDVGLDWLNNIGDTDDMGEYLEENTGASEIADYVEGLAAHILMQYGPFDVVAEYVRALDEFQIDEMAFAGSGAEPEAWSLEAGLTFEWLNRQTIFSLAWQGTDEALALGLPEDRYGAAIRMFVLKNTSVSLEYLHDEDYDKADGGTGNDADSATMQVAVEF
ncbi:MAG: LbtU family siderophore porin [Proteobacteria bacterium]|nr:LbtU family siderophore porin [Pseudomonadota bacterium]MBU4297578.1 LbtU family siderophore porin [Pseudomonadota bacterium]MCG2748844.1 LbtU family siderophore porin [Desulfobulbaceae bacterium]